MPSAEMSSHLADADPHPQYQLETGKNQPDGYTGLGHDGLVLRSRLAFGPRTGVEFLRSDGWWAVPPGTGGGGGSQSFAFFAGT